MPRDSDKKAKIEYWTKRLDHAANHIQNSSRLVYLVDGAVLAFVYFLADKIGYSRHAILGTSFIFLLIATINYLHSEFIRHMNNEYKNINNKLLALVGDQSEHTWPKGHLVIEYDHYRLIHWIISFFLLIVFLVTLLYGLGCFREIHSASMIS